MSTELWTHLGQLIVAEITKLQSRPAARIGWVVMAALGLLAPAFQWLVAGATLEVNGAPAAIDTAAATGVRWALVARNFYIAQAVILVIGALSVAGEFQARTLREDLLRPVPRWAVLLAKWLALSTWSAVALAAQWIVAVLVGLTLLSSEGASSWSDVFAAYGVSLLTDASFAATVLLVAVASRSVSGTIGVMFLFIVLERFLGALLWFGRSLREGLPDAAEQIPAFVHWALDAAPFLPASAWQIWSPLSEGLAPDWQSWVALCGITVAAAIGAERVFARVDVP